VAVAIGTAWDGGSSVAVGDHGGCGVAIAEGQWRSKGACQGLDPDIFYPDNDDHADVAKAVCDECQVRIACLNHALDNREHQGVWGGATARERRRLLRQRRRIA
jgi:WhiB family redox-sensing transcriptional regulator